jgi:hypothetical protein
VRYFYVSLFVSQTGGLPRNAPATSATSVKTKKMKNRIFAIPAAAPAMLVKPRTAAMIATTKNVNAQDNMTNLLIRFLNAQAVNATIIELWRRNA